MGLINASAKLVEILTWLKDNFDALKTVVAAQGKGTGTSGALGISIAPGKPPLSPNERIVWVRVNASAGGGGKYTGFFQQRAGTATSSDATGLVAADFGTDLSGGDCVIYNAAEAGQTSHALTVTGNVNKIFPGVLRGANSSGRPIVWINGVALKDDCT